MFNISWPNIYFSTHIGYLWMRGIPITQFKAKSCKVYGMKSSHNEIMINHYEIIHHNLSL